MNKFVMVWLWMTATISSVAERAERDGDRGEIPEWIVKTAIMVALAAAVGGVIAVWVSTKAATVTGQ